MPEQITQIEQVELEFEEEADELNPDSLALYLLSLNTVYKAANGILSEVSLDEFYDRQEEFLREIRAAVQRDYLAHGRLTFDTDSKGFQIIKLVYGSKLTIGIKGAFKALIAAAIINGGEVDLPGGAKVKLHSTGQGMRDIREAVTPAPGFKQVEPQGAGRVSPPSTEPPGEAKASSGN